MRKDTQFILGYIMRLVLLFLFWNRSCNSLYTYLYKYNPYLLWAGGVVLGDPVCLSACLWGITYSVVVALTAVLLLLLLLLFLFLLLPAAILNKSFCRQWICVICPGGLCHPDMAFLLRLHFFRVQKQGLVEFHHFFPSVCRNFVISIYIHTNYNNT